MTRSLDRLDNCIRILDDTTEIGNDTLGLLDEQTEKINLIGKKTSDMNPQINRSRYIINNMFAHNKKKQIIQYLVLLLLVIIGIIIIILIATKN
jgi:t-SNARE complex subunit (syntaxin)